MQTIISDAEKKAGLLISGAEDKVKQAEEKVKLLESEMVGWVKAKSIISTTPILGGERSSSGGPSQDLDAKQDPKRRASARIPKKVDGE